MRVECCTGRYEEALEFYRKYQAKMKNEMDINDIKPNQETFLDIGITLLMNFQIEEALENFTEASKFRNRNDSKLPKSVLDKANELTHIAASTQIELHDDYFMTIHVAWSYYYLFLGLIGYFTTHNVSTKESENTYNAITNFTRCITLNPTLPESFYYRAVLRCYAQTCIENKSLDSMTKSEPNQLTNLDSEKRNTRYGRNTRRFNQIIGNKIVSSNLLREALNDVLNANALKNISITNSEKVIMKSSENEVSFTMKLMILKCFILHCLERKKDALIEIEKISKLNKNSDLLFEIAAIKALITKSEEDVKDAFRFEKDEKFIGTKSEKLSSIILEELSHLNFPLDTNE
jgi:tetratricopeptide (TPR) repeat protein